jgi:hypothetical protein
VGLFEARPRLFEAVGRGSRFYGEGIVGNALSIGGLPVWFAPFEPMGIGLTAKESLARANFLTGLRRACEYYSDGLLNNPTA